MIRRLLAHCRALWPRWTLLPGLPFVGWAVYSLAVGERRWEIMLLGVFGLIAYVGPRAKSFYLGLAPAALVGIMYDAMRFFQGVGLSPGSVHVCDLRDLEMRFFGIDLNGRTTTVHEYIQAHSTLGLDVFFSFPYAFYLEQIVFFGALLYFVDKRAMSRFSWAFFALNALGFLTHHLYPAAAPWYYATHGCTVDIKALGSEGTNLARVDAWLGVPYFASFYARSKDVFGAMPSLHAAYPLLVVMECLWPSRVPGKPSLADRPRLLAVLRIASIAFFLWMCGAAVYLDHHWILDVVVGVAYGVVVFLGIRHVEQLVDTRWSAREAVRIAAAADSGFESK